MVLCEMCGANVDIDYSTGDEGCMVTCPNCGRTGMLYVGITEMDENSAEEG